MITSFSSGIQLHGGIFCSNILDMVMSGIISDGGLESHNTVLYFLLLVFLLRLFVLCDCQKKRNYKW